MTIKDYIKKEENIKINNILFELLRPSYYESEDVNKKIKYDDTTSYSYMERLEFAKKEIEKDIKTNCITNSQELLNFYKENIKSYHYDYAMPLQILHTT